MSRPRTGLSLAEALRHCDPETWEEIQSLAEAIDGARIAPGKHPGHKVTETDACKRLFTEFRRRLCDGELIASATHERPDPTNPRFVIDPDLMGKMYIRLDLDEIVGEGMRLRNPEVFTPDAVPLNIRHVPDWLRELAGEVGGGHGSPAAGPASGAAARAGRRRARSGLRIEEALERWSDRDEWTAMNALSDARNPVSSSADPPPREVVRHQQYRRLRDKLEAGLRRRLREGQLIASATDERPSPSDPRFVVSPETFDRVGFAWDWPDAMIGIGGSIHNVEIFPPDEIPLNVDPEDLLRWLRPAALAGEPEGPKQASVSEVPEFQHYDDYRHVELRGQEYPLTDLQAKIVKVLHEAYLSAGSSWMRLEDIRAAVGFESESLHQLFRRMSNWQELIRSDGRGYYRLNVSD